MSEWQYGESQQEYLGTGPAPLDDKNPTWNEPRQSLTERPWRTPPYPAPRQPIYPGQSGSGGCRKCGAWNINTVYVPDVDVLRKACMNCGYRWTEPPKDRRF